MPVNRVLFDGWPLCRERAKRWTGAKPGSDLEELYSMGYRRPERKA